EIQTLLAFAVLALIKCYLEKELGDIFTVRPGRADRFLAQKNGGRERERDREIERGLGMVAVGCCQPDRLWEKSPFFPQM
ncbi:hypothetical protein A2U01_0024494, partial [Trifolium medium]|nr:hypothetical protein [Trifolium medium]